MEFPRAKGALTLASMACVGKVVSGCRLKGKEVLNKKRRLLYFYPSCDRVTCASKSHLRSPTSAVHSSALTTPHPKTKLQQARNEHFHSAACLDMYPPSRSEEWPRQPHVAVFAWQRPQEFSRMPRGSHAGRGNNNAHAHITCNGGYVQ